MNATLSTVHGMPRIGPDRELKIALESYWSGDVDAERLRAVASRIRAGNRRLMADAGIDLPPCNDFSLYDHVLDATVLVGAVPERFGHPGGLVGLDTYFAMARGAGDAAAMEITKWFDTNYHRLVPELGPRTRFELSSEKPFDELAEAAADGPSPKPVLLGPLSWLLVSKPAEGVDAGFDPLTLLPGLLDVYAEVLVRLGEMGARWVQLDEPALVVDSGARELAALRDAYGRLATARPRPRLCVSTYFGDVGEAYATLADLPVEGIGLDFVAGEENLRLIRERGGLGDRTLFAGVVDGRNVWVADLSGLEGLLEELRRHAAELVVSTSCSLQHVPLERARETALDEELRDWLSFATDKLGEVADLAHGLGPERREENRRRVRSRRESERVRDPAVRERLEQALRSPSAGRSHHRERRSVQRERLGLPVLPITTIGSFPQRPEIRRWRRRLVAGDMDRAEYERHLREEIAEVIATQEDLGIDVLVHGEPERHDMVQYFAEQLEGCAVTEHGWVQSYGSGCTRPPIVFGDVARPQPMTVRWLAYAQSLTDRPVKAMLTGPVTMTMWAFVRDDQPPAETCRQFALAIRDEVADLEAAGLPIIQVDEPALREGVPLRRADRDEYVGWAVQCFVLATGVARDETQIHSHMCYAEFGDILDAIAALDADVVSIEAAHSGMDVLEPLRRAGYDRDVGPGIYDVHSARVPAVEEMAASLGRAADCLGVERLWVNPDCGLKARRYEEAVPALRNMVAAAVRLRVRVDNRGDASR